MYINFGKVSFETVMFETSTLGYMKPSVLLTIQIKQTLLSHHIGAHVYMNQHYSILFCKYIRQKRFSLSTELHLQCLNILGMHLL